MSDFFDLPKTVRREDERYEFSDTDTHMVHFLKDLLQQRLLFKWAKERGISELKIFRYAVGVKQADKIVHVRTPPRDIVFSYRDVIQPARWFVPYNNPLPTPIAFHATHEYKDLLSKPTVGRLLLSDRVGKRRNMELHRETLNDIAQEIGVKYYRLYYMTLSRNNLFIFPPTEVVYALSKYIPIDTWFIFPDELDDENVKRMFIDRSTLSMFYGD